ncbi:MAG: hypothetical protein ACI892_000381, partial [Marinobacter maritimus]
TKRINEVINDCEGKISTNKASIAGDSCSHFKTHNSQLTTQLGMILTSKGEHFFSSFGIIRQRVR